jgi:hypothetical protein
MPARAAFLAPDNRFVLVGQVGEFVPALRHLLENRCAWKRHVSSLRARCAVGRACTALMSANHGVPPV